MSQQTFAFGKENFILIAFAIALIITGFCLMSGGGSTDGISYNPEIFSTRRIVIAPTISLLGFILIIVGILKKSKK